jgi:hypothetical protein
LDCSDLYPVKEGDLRRKGSRRASTAAKKGKETVASPDDEEMELLGDDFGGDLEA